MTWVRIDCLPLCFAIVVDDHKVVRSAPVGKWMIGKDTGVMLAYWNKRGAKINLIL